MSNNSGERKEEKKNYLTEKKQKHENFLYVVASIDNTKQTKEIHQREIEKTNSACMIFFFRNLDKDIKLKAKKNDEII